MDVICEIIETLTSDDRKEFSDFLNRHRIRKDRKDLELFEMLANRKGKIKRDILLQKLYPEDKNADAYHATRKRLLRQLMEFIQLKKRRGDGLSEGYILGLVSTAEYLFEFTKYEAAWSILKQAEDLATKGESFTILNNIFSIQVEHANSEFAPDFKELLTKKQQFQRLAFEDDNANVANQLIRFELNRSLSTGKEMDISLLIKNVLAQYNLSETVIQRPKLLYNIVSITRSAVLARKEFYTFEPYIIEKYLEIERRNGFNKYNHFYKVSFLYMIAHVLYRNKKFKDGEEYLKLLYRGLEEHHKSHFSLLYPKYVLLLAAVYNYSGRNQEAIELVEKLINTKKVKLDTAQLLNAYLNLSTYYFQQDAYHKSIRVFQNLQHSDQWLTKIMGFEWVLKKNIVECINQFELGNPDLVEQRIKGIEKNFKEYFERPMYRRVGVFLSLVKRLNNDPSQATAREFQNLVESSFEFIEAGREDIQAMTFYGWLKSKMQKKNYYEVLLELLR